MLTIFFGCLFFFSHLCFNMTLESIFFLSILCLHTHTPVVFWLFSPFYSQELFCYFCFEVYQFSRSCYFLKFFSSSQNWKEKIICIDLMIFWPQNRSVLPQDAIFRSSIMTKRLERLCIVWKKKLLLSRRRSELQTEILSDMVCLMSGIIAWKWLFQFSFQPKSSPPQSVFFCFCFYHWENNKKS